MASSSIKAMIDRFRSSEPTSRDDRLARREKGMIREMWFERGNTTRGRTTTGNGSRRGDNHELSRTIAVTPDRRPTERRRDDERRRRGDDNREGGYRGERGSRDGGRRTTTGTFRRSDGYDGDDRNHGGGRDDGRGDGAEDYRRRSDNGDDGGRRDEHRRRRRDERDGHRRGGGRDESAPRARLEPRIVSSSGGAVGGGGAAGMRRALPLELLTESHGSNLRGSFDPRASLRSSYGGGGGHSHHSATTTSVDDMIARDLIASLGGGSNGVVGRHDSFEEPRKEELPPPPPLPTAANGFSGTMPEPMMSDLPRSLSLVATNLENALMPFKQLYLRKEQVRENERENLRLLAAARCDPGMVFGWFGLFVCFFVEFFFCHFLC